MKNIKEMLDAVVEPIKLGDNSGFSNFLTEESDFEETRIITEEDDPFGGGGDAGNDAGGDAGGQGRCAKALLQPRGAGPVRAGLHL